MGCIHQRLRVAESRVRPQVMRIACFLSDVQKVMHRLVSCLDFRTTANIRPVRLTDDRGSVLHATEIDRLSPPRVPSQYAVQFVA
jgi:hypothetical protein